MAQEEADKAEYEAYVKAQKDRADYEEYKKNNAAYQEYLAANGGAQVSAQSPIFFDLKNPAGSPVDFMTRFKYKNVLHGTGDDKARLEWLKKEQPELQWAMRDSEPWYAAKDSNEYYKMDPSNFELQDVTDVAGDLATGGLSGMATAGGFMAGGPVGAAAAGGAASGALETARQLMAKGMHGGDVNKTAIGIQTVMGAAAPKLFGVGLSGAQIAAQAAAKNVPVETVKKEIAGIVPELAKQGFSRVANALSGVSHKAILGYAKYRPQIEKMIGRGNAIPEASDIHGKVTTLVESARQQAGQELQNEIGQAHSLFNTRSLFQPVFDKKAELEAMIQNIGAKRYWQGGRNAPKSVEDQLSAVQKVLDDEFGGMADNIAPGDLFKMQKTWKNKAAFDVDMRKLRAENPEAANIAEVYRELYTGINKRLEAATQGRSKELKAKVKQLIDLNDDIDVHFSTPETTLNYLMGMESNAARGDSRRHVAEQIRQLSGNAIDLAEDYLKFDAYKHFRAPNLYPISSAGTTSTTRTTALSLLGAGAGAPHAVSGYGLLGAVEGLTGGLALPAVAGPMAMKQYTKGARYAGQAYDMLPNVVQKIPPYLMSNEILKMMYGEQPEQEQIP